MPVTADEPGVVRLGPVLTLRAAFAKNVHIQYVLIIAQEDNYI